MVWPTALLLNRTGIIACGCNVFLNSKKLFFNITICLTILIPPLVDPAEPPTKNRAKNTPVAKKLHMVKSAVTKPVVVMIEVTWKRACLIALSVAPKISGWAMVVCRASSLKNKMIKATSVVMLKIPKK